MPRLLQRFRRYRRLVLGFAFIAIALMVSLIILLAEQQQLSEDLTQLETELHQTRQTANLGNRTREQAEELAAYLLDDLRSELVPLGRTEILGSSAEKTLAYFQELPPALTNSGTQEAKASILSTLANVRHANGDFQEACLLWDQAITLHQEQLDDDPSNLDLILQLSSDYNQKAIPLRKAGQYKEAIAANKEALALLKNLSPKLHSNPEVEIAKASTLFSMGENERDSGNAEGAISYYKLSRKSFSGKIPNETLALQTVMTSYNNEGWCYMDLEDDIRAEASYLKALEPARRLVVKEPDNRHWQKEIATLLNNLGTIYDERGEPQKARPYFQEALAMRASLVSWDPTNTRWQTNYANSLRNLGSLRLDEGNPQDALELVQESLRVYQTLLTREPENEIWLRTLQRETRHYHERFTRAGETEMAQALNTEVRNFVESLANTQPMNSAAWNQFLSKLYNDFSLNEETSSEDSLAARLKSTTLRAQNLTANTEDLDTRYQMAAGYLDLALNCLWEEKQEEALPCFQLARFLFQEKCPPLLYDREALIDFTLRREEALRPSNTSSLIPARSLWKYYDSRTPPGDQWQSTDFDDSQWLEGRGQLGYGDGDENTLLDYGPDSERKNLTAWFRHHLILNPKTTPQSDHPIRISLLCDDGAIVYLNGQEVLRHNMPEGEVSPTTVASRTQAGRDEDIYRVFTFDPSELPFNEESNLWAAEVHQNEPSSSDLSFDLEVLANAPIPDPLQDFDLAFASEFLGEALPQVVRTWLEEHQQERRP